MMRLRTVTPLVALALTLILAQAPLVSGAASYSLSISPNVPVSLGTGMTFTLTLSGATRNSAYTVLFDVVKPNGTGSALATKVITTNNAGAGSVSVNYPDPSFTALNGTVATDVGGVYDVYVNQTSPSPNSQVQSGQFTVSSNLTVDSLITYNSQGHPSTSFSAGDTIYASFVIRYSYGTNNYLSSGQYAVQVRNPSGTVVANLTAAYDSFRRGFYTGTGYPVSAFDPGGTWTVGMSANSINDGFGNTGPGLSTSVPLQIATSPLSYWPFVVAGIVAVLGGVVTVKRFDMYLEGFQHLDQLMGGPLPRGSSILLLGDAGSGKTILSYQLLHEELDSGKLCALLSYDAFPEDVQARMNEFGWDIVSHLRKGRLKIIDCYSSLAGQGEGAIKDPSDLTELNIQVTAFIGRAKGGPVTVVLDSLTPIFNGVEEKQAINFIQTLGAKVKKTGGLFILTASKGAIPDESASKLKTMVDGVIELSIVRGRGRAHRFLSVVKMERRTISSSSVAFEIDRTRGLVFRVSRFGLMKKQLVSFLRMREGLAHAKSTLRRPEAQAGRGSPTTQR